MSNHLPECPYRNYEAFDESCICDRLRACEQRVRQDEYQRCSKDRELHVRDARLGMWQACRDAVEASSWVNHPDIERDDYSTAADWQRDIDLAAIDALKGASDE